jgi:AraC family transcriptional activator of tynA and feaB
MSLQEFESRIAGEWHLVPFDDWTYTLQSVCGRFQTQARDNAAHVLGGVSLSVAGGMEVAQVANNLDIVRRDRDDIRRDFGEHMFLLLQLEGSCGIEQFGRQSVIAPGDCILVDSAAPSTFHFDGRFSNQLSAHLPRQLLLAEKADEIGVSRRLAAADPMSALLHALLAKLLQTDAGSRRAPELRQLLLQATRQAFAVDPDEARALPNERVGGRLEIAQLLVDRHLTEDLLTPQWLAGRLGVSLRTLQEDFATLGTTVTAFIRARRLSLARDRLAAMRVRGESETIAEIALASGFNDISYFNRCFRKAFDCSPKDISPKDPRRS